MMVEEIFHGGSPRLSFVPLHGSQSWLESYAHWVMHHPVALA
jgi:hypothetical protein